MKKSTFILRTVGSEIHIIHNGNPLKKCENYKKALKVLALYMCQKGIENFNLFVYERNRLEKIEDFDPELVLNSYNNSKKNSLNDRDFRLDDDDEDDLDDFGSDRDFRLDDDEDLDFRRNRRPINEKFSDRGFERPKRGPIWVYKPSDNQDEIDQIKRNLRNLVPKD